LKGSCGHAPYDGGVARTTDADSHRRKLIAQTR
jgi:hypothetical protein